MWVWDYIEILLVGVVFAFAILAKLDPVLFTSLFNFVSRHIISIGVFLLTAVLKVVAFLVDGLQQVF